MRIRNISSWIMVFCVIPLASCFTDCIEDEVLSIQNNTDQTIVFELYNDTTFSDCTYQGLPGENIIQAYESGEMWYNLNVYNRCKRRTLITESQHLYIFSLDTIDTYTWDYVLVQGKYLKRYDFYSIEDLEKIDFKVQFP